MKDFYEMQYEKNGDKVINYFKSLNELKYELRSIRYSREYIEYVEKELLKAYKEKNRSNTIHYEDANIKVKLLKGIPNECVNTIRKLKQQTSLDIYYYDLVGIREALNKFTYRVCIFDECKITYNKCVGYRCLIKLNNEEYTTHSIDSECFIKYVVELIKSLLKMHIPDADMQRRARIYIERQHLKHYRIKGKHLIYNVTYERISKKKVKLETIQYDTNLLTWIVESKVLKRVDKQGLENRYMDDVKLSNMFK